MNSHGFQQGVVMEGPFRYCGNIIAVEAAGGWKSKKTHERLRHKCTKPDLTASETVVKRVETQTMQSASISHSNMYRYVDPSKAVQWEINHI